MFFMFFVFTRFFYSLFIRKKKVTKPRTVTPHGQRLFLVALREPDGRPPAVCLGIAVAMLSAENVLQVYYKFRDTESENRKNC
jgi:hypothetical protein